MNGARLQDVAMLYWLWAIPALAARLFLRGLAPAAGARALRASPICWRASTAGRARAAAASRPCCCWAPSRFWWWGWRARPGTRSRRPIKRQGRDVVFLLDVSKSMLAEDLVPNRLERAKLAILDAVDRLQGDRVALVAFAGTAVVKCPLTLDYGFFRLALRRYRARKRQPRRHDDRRRHSQDARQLFSDQQDAQFQRHHSDHRRRGPGKLSGRSGPRRPASAASG